MIKEDGSIKSKPVFPACHSQMALLRDTADHTSSILAWNTPLGTTASRKSLFPEYGTAGNSWASFRRGIWSKKANILKSGNLTLGCPTPHKLQFHFAPMLLTLRVFGKKIVERRGVRTPLWPWLGHVPGAFPRRRTQSSCILKWTDGQRAESMNFRQESSHGSSAITHHGVDTDETRFTFIQQQPIGEKCSPLKALEICWFTETEAKGKKT